AGVDVRFAATGSNNTFAPATATTDAAGHATSAFSSTLSGSRTISATVGGLALSQTQVVTVVPGVADPGQTTAKVPGSGHENHPTVITVQARDQFGNKLVTGGSAVVVTVTGANNAGPIYATDNGDGTYTASYTPPNKGTDYVVITLGGVAISGSPYRSKVG
ncbi:MAG TPA: filamin/ABP280 repeat domain-containing protein, partial [Gemmatimonadales bacterium]|nr:filamin/ABP280 repeat domain-containing protein [Gemmatimonadales bacterium]